MRHILSNILVMLLLTLCTVPAHSDDQAEPVTIFAAASLTDVLPALTTEWSRATGTAAPRLSFGPSAVMARQVAAGAPADIVLSANPEWIDFLAERELLVQAPAIIAENRLVLVTPGTGLRNRGELDLETVARITKGTRVAIADPAIAPAGKYAKAYLTQLGLWAELAPRAAFATSVRQALVLVERGGLPGFVYATDAELSALVNVVGTVPRDNTPPIIYAAGRTQRPNEEADALYQYLRSPAAKQIWEKFGFLPIVPN